jgi:hypothetical protein
MKDITKYERYLENFYAIQGNESKKDFQGNIKAMIDICPPLFMYPPYYGRYFKVEINPLLRFIENFEKKLPYGERVELFEKMKTKGIKEGVISSDNEILPRLYPRKTFLEKVQERLKRRSKWKK